MSNDNFVSKMNSSQRVLTENGALGYATVGDKLVDLNYLAGSIRTKDDTSVITAFCEAFDQHAEDTLKWLFYLRDVRGGMGERNAFKVIAKYLAESKTDVLKPLIPLIPEYGRWDDLLCFIGTPLEETALSTIKKEFDKELKLVGADSNVKNPTSFILGKWLPSENASSDFTIKNARIVRKFLKLDSKTYRKDLSLLRKLNHVVEVKMASKDWKDINYSEVPSKAMSNYKGAFKNHDKDRFDEFIGKAVKGEAKISAGALTPPDILHAELRTLVGSTEELTCEAQWKNLKEYSKDLGGTMVVADTSGSMDTPISISNKTTCLEVSVALAIYSSHYCKGGFKDHLISFSKNPELYAVNNSLSLRKKFEKVSSKGGYDTNMQAVFELILKTAVDNEMKQEDLPDSVLVISDMEFNDVCLGSLMNMPSDYSQKELFTVISDEYKAKGYHLPKLVFWNVGNRSGAIPVQSSKYGLTYISGYSQSALQMVTNGAIKPLDALLKLLHSSRYDPIKLVETL